MNSCSAARSGLNTQVLAIFYHYISRCLGIREQRHKYCGEKGVKFQRTRTFAKGTLTGNGSGYTHTAAISSLSAAVMKHHS